jgi:DNA-binding response OmpR family regulator
VYASLILDADEPARIAIQNALHPYGFKFEAFADPNEAVARAAEKSPDLLFLRVELPSMSGFSVFNKLKRADATKNIPVILYASDVAQDVFDRHKTLRSHAQAYLKLPVSDAELVEAVGSIVALEALPRTGGETIEIELAQGTSVNDDDLVELVSDDEVDVGDEDFDLAAEMDDELSRALGEITLDAIPEAESEPHAELQEELDAEPALEPEPKREIEPAKPLLSPMAGGKQATVHTATPSKSAASSAAPVASDPTIELESAEIDDRTFAGLDDDAELEPPTSSDQSGIADDLLAQGAIESMPTLHARPEPAPSAAVASAPEKFNKLATEDEAGDTATLAKLAASVDRPDRVAHSDDTSHVESSSTGGLAQRREILNIKAQLVKKDRELLQMRDEIETAQRSVLDERRKARELQAQIGELESSRLNFEENSLNLQEALNAAQQDKATILRREEGLKQRLETQQKRLRQVEQDLETALQTTNEGRRQYQAQVAALESDLESLRKREEQLAREVQRSTESLREQESATKIALDRLASAEKVHGESREQWELERQRLLGQLDEERERAKQQLSVELERQSQNWEQRLAKATTEFQLQLARKDEEQRAQIDHVNQQLADERAGFTRKIEAAMAVVETRELELARAKQDLEGAHAEHADLRRMQSEQAALLARESENVAAAQAEIAELKRALAEENSVLTARQDAIRRAQQALAIALKVLDQP